MSLLENCSSWMHEGIILLRNPEVKAFFFLICNKKGQERKLKSLMKEKIITEGLSYIFWYWLLCFHFTRIGQVSCCTGSEGFPSTRLTLGQFSYKGDTSTVPTHSTLWLQMVPIQLFWSNQCPSHTNYHWTSLPEWQVRQCTHPSQQEFRCQTPQGTMGDTVIATNNWISQSNLF